MEDGRPHPPADLAAFELLPGVEQACDELGLAGYVLVVVTNQPDIARGTQDAAVVEAMHERLRQRLPIAAVYVCAHDDADRCHCRKPEPGLILDAARDLDLDLERSVFVGDRWRDIEAGRRAGCRTVFIDHGYDERRPEGEDYVAVSLLESVPWITSEVPASRPA